jgi:cytochrome c-type biogenesis protein CcmE
VPKKLFIVGALVVAAGAIAWMAFGGLGENLVYYWSPAELVAAGDKAYGAKVRLGGLVKAGSVQWKPRETNLRFQVTDGKAVVDVHASAVPPAMFRENIGVVIEGTYSRAHVFESERLLVKHGNEYQAPKEGAPKDMEKLMRTVSEAGES